ncbi:MAG: DUF1566 domain-containing protein [Gammaproteobacteria bacterium]|nr:DUF1566 domain-containing protein [Gammaproteobacteria bacterium]
MKLKSLFSIILMLSVVSLSQADQECDASKPESTPTSRFKDNNDGTVTDKTTNRTWLRCALGMEWKEGSCIGQTQEYTYGGAESAIDVQNKMRVAGRSDWRIPTVDELSGIVEKRCARPAINLKVFPYSPESGFWTSTENPGIVTERVWLVHFFDGRSYIANKNQTWRLRPVAGK